MVDSIDLSQLPSLDAVETIDFETIVEEIETAVLIKFQENNIPITEILESDPMSRLIQSFAYREVYLRQRINEAIRAVLIATAQPDDLTELFKLFDASNLTGEDSNARQKFYEALRAFTTVGSVAAYIEYAKNADTRVKDVHVTSMQAGYVNIIILSNEGSGFASANLIATVQNSLRNDEIRPITDYVVVQSAEIIEYKIEVELTLFGGPGIDSVKTAARQAVENYVTQRHNLGICITRAGITGALHQEGVVDVELTLSDNQNESGTFQEVDGDINVLPTQAAFCDADTGIIITTKGLPVINELAPVELPKAIEFIDQDSDDTTLTGIVIVYPADDESTITDYVLYWASAPNRALEEIQVLPTTGTTVKHEFTGKEIPDGANYLLAVTKNQYGEMLVGVNLLIGDSENNV